MIETKDKIYLICEKHLAGMHNQKNHGRRGGGLTPQQRKLKSSVMKKAAGEIKALSETNQKFLEAHRTSQNPKKTSEERSVALGERERLLMKRGSAWQKVSLAVARGLGVNTKVDGKYMTLSDVKKNPLYQEILKDVAVKTKDPFANGDREIKI